VLENLGWILDEAQQNNIGLGQADTRAVLRVRRRCMCSWATVPGLLNYIRKYCVLCVTIWGTV
jgi:hypothetical protein